MAQLAPITQDLILRSKAYQQGMADANKRLKRFKQRSAGAGAAAADLGRKIRGLGAAALAAGGITGVGALTQSSIAFGSTQSDVAAQLKINTVAFQVYAGALKDAGGSQEQMQKSIVSMTQAVVQGDEGMSTFTRAFGRLGLDVKQLRQLKPEAQFEQIAQAVAQATDKQGAFTAVTEIFGKRAAPQLIEVMERLSRDGFGKMSDEVRETFGIMESETQKRLDRAADRIEQFKQRATIKFGELIAGEADGAAVKILSAQLLGAVANFSVGLLEVVYKTAATIPTFIGGALEGVANKFGFSFEAVGLRFQIALKEAANSVISKLNEVSGTSFSLFNLGGSDGEFRKLAEIQKRVEAGGDGVLDTALSKVEKLWKSSPLQGWKDDVDAGTAAIVEAYQGDLDAARAAAALRESTAAGGVSGVDVPTVPPTVAAAGMAGAARVAGSLPSIASDAAGFTAPTAGVDAELSGEALRRAANAQGAADGIRFDRQGDGSFSRFIDGQASGNFSAEDLQGKVGTSPAAGKQLDDAGEGVSVIAVMTEILNILKPLSNALSGSN